MSLPSSSLNKTLGAALVGNVLAACFYGLTTLQTYIYYGRSRKDSTTLKSLIALLWVLDTAHLILVSHTVYEYAVTNFGNYPALLKPTWSVLAQVVVTGVSDGIVRGIFCYRIWILSGKNSILCTALCISLLVTFGCSQAYPIKSFELVTFVDLQQLSWLLYLGLTSVLLSDLLLTTVLCVLLSKRRSTFRRVDNTVRTLIMYSVNTGALTTLCSLVSLIAYAASPHTLVYVAFYFLLPKLFLNSLLATLNARKQLRDHMSGKTSTFPRVLETLTAARLAVDDKSVEMDDVTMSPKGVSKEDDLRASSRAV